MIKVLFLIHDLGQGGAEKVLVNLVNNMNKEKFDISIIALFGGGVNEQFLKPEIHYKVIFPKMFPGNSHIMKMFTPRLLHKWFVKDKYDIEISYLEGPSARIVSGCDDLKTKIVAWVHCTMNSERDITEGFRCKQEAKACYNKMSHMVFVSEEVRISFLKNCNYKGKTSVLYNTVESSFISENSKEEVTEMDENKINFIAVGSLKPIKGFDRLLRIIKRLHDENYPVCLYILGIGEMKKEIEQIISNNSLEENVFLLGYQTNPYKYMRKSDLFVCSSLAEGFSTATTEALLVGTPVCTVEVSGMKEMLGYNNEFGIITKNNEESLYKGLKMLLDNPTLLLYYKKQATIRGNMFKKEQTVKDVEKMLINLLEEE